MKLNQFTDYGLRILMYIAQKETATAPTITELAERFRISRNHLVKVVQFLSNQKIIKAQRGRGGGMRLGKDPKELLIGDLVHLLEHGEKLVSCEDPPCILLANCSLRTVLDEAYRDMIASLNRYALYDLVKGKTGVLIDTLKSVDNGGE